MPLCFKRDNKTVDAHAGRNKSTQSANVRRPEVSLNELVDCGIVSLNFESFSKEEQLDLLDEAETTIKYEGYISRQNALVERLSKNEAARIPSSFEYNRCVGISLEAREKLSLLRPETIGQASRISGVSPADVAAQSSMTQEIERVLENLSDRERRVLRLRFGLADGRPRTLEEIGGELSLTRERIRQIERKALNRLRIDKSVGELRELLI